MINSRNLISRIAARISREVMQVVRLPLEVAKASRLLRDIRELQLETLRARDFPEVERNPINDLGARCFSQADEDGITLEILKRLDAIGPGVFAELGVGDGTENNTLVLKCLGWKGVWIGGQALKVRTTESAGLAFTRAWITVENILDLLTSSLKRIDEKSIDVISLDLDGNDYHFVEAILNANFQPKLFIVEYNAKFIPPIEWISPYEDQRTWEGGDYFGASLVSFVKLFKKYKYRLVCCNNATGANAFFVPMEFDHRFNDMPIETERLYRRPRYLISECSSHPTEVRTVESLTFR